MAAAVGAIAAAAAVARRRAEQAAAQVSSVEVFERYATRWHLDVERRLGADAPAPRMSGALVGLRCAFEIAIDGQGWAHTQLVAEGPLANDAAITVVPNPHGVLSSIKRALFGHEHVLLDDPPFDEHFLVHAEPRRDVETLLDAEVRSALKRWLAHRLEAFTYDHGRVALQWGGVELDPEVLDAALALVARAAAWRRSDPNAAYR